MKVQAVQSMKRSQPPIIPTLRRDPRFSDLCAQIQYLNLSPMKGDRIGGRMLSKRAWQAGNIWSICHFSIQSQMDSGAERSQSVAMDNNSDGWVVISCWWFDGAIFSSDILQFLLSAFSDRDWRETRQAFRRNARHTTTGTDTQVEFKHAREVIFRLAVKIKNKYSVV